MGLLNFSNIEGVQTMDCCGGVMRDELASTRDEPPHKIKGCIPHKKIKELNDYWWEWESKCTGSGSPACCRGNEEYNGGECQANEKGGYYKNRIDVKFDYKKSIK